MTYQQALQYLYSSQPAFHLIGKEAYKPGLGNTYALMRHLHNPHECFRSVHVAGTNGKGSVSHTLAAVFQAAGYKTALYTSPHLVDFRERIRINGQMIPKEAVVAFVEQNSELLDTVKPSFFETTMAMAFQHFAEEKVDIAIVEVGLGGRLDSTNIISPCLSIITNIGFDHTEFLGTTLAQIASEKAGTIKEGIPVVVSEMTAETREVFYAKAALTHSRLIEVEHSGAHQSLYQLCQLKGIYQRKNIDCVVAAAAELRHQGYALSDEALETGLRRVCELTGLRGRWETLSEQPKVICDTGHNSHGVKAYIDALNEYEKLNIVFGMVSDKDVKDVLRLLPRHARYFFTQAQTTRAIPAHKLQQLGAAAGLIGCAYHSVSEALNEAIKKADKDTVVFIGGSNYVVGEALQAFDS